MVLNLVILAVSYVFRAVTVEGLTAPLWSHLDISPSAPSPHLNVADNLTTARRGCRETPVLLLPIETSLSSAHNSLVIWSRGAPSCAPIALLCCRLRTFLFRVLNNVNKSPPFCPPNRPQHCTATSLGSDPPTAALIQSGM